MSCESSKGIVLWIILFGGGTKLGPFLEYAPISVHNVLSFMTRDERKLFLALLLYVWNWNAQPMGYELQKYGSKLRNTGKLLKKEGLWIRLMNERDNLSGNPQGEMASQSFQLLRCLALFDGRWFPSVSAAHFWRSSNQEINLEQAPPWKRRLSFCDWDSSRPKDWILFTCCLESMWQEIMTNAILCTIDYKNTW